MSASKTFLLSITDADDNDLLVIHDEADDECHTRIEMGSDGVNLSDTDTIELHTFLGRHLGLEEDG